MTFSPNGMLAEARSHVGFHEGRNNANPFTLWQTQSYSTEPWCDSFCCYCAYVGGGYRFPWYSLWGTRGDWNVGAHHQHAVREGIWRYPGGYVASAGDLVVLDFGQRDQHIEIVVTDMGPGRYPRVVTIGGNTGDQVAWRSRYSANIDGFIALTQSAQHDGPDPHPAPVPIPKPVEVEMQTVVDELHPGSKPTLPRAINIDAKGNIYVNNGIKLEHNGTEVKVGKIGGRWIAPSDADASKLEYQGHVVRKKEIDGLVRIVGVRQFFWDAKKGLQTRDYDFVQ